MFSAAVPCTYPARHRAALQLLPAHRRSGRIHPNIHVLLVLHRGDPAAELLASFNPVPHVTQRRQEANRV